MSVIKSEKKDVTKSDLSILLESTNEFPFTGAVPSDKVNRLIEELHDHHVELEVQNDELLTAQKQLKEARDKYSELYNMAPVGYLTVIKNGTIIEANDTILKILGMGKADIINQPFTKYIFEEDQDNYYKFRQRLFKTNRSQTVELRLRLKTGDFLWVNVDGGMVKSANSNYIHLHLAISEITNRKKVELQLIQAKNEWENTFNAINDMVVILSSSMRVVRANKAAKKLMKISLSDLPGRHCYEAFCGRDEVCKGCPVVETLRDLKSYSAELENSRLGRTFFLSSSPIIDKEGRCSSVVYLVRDITERVRLESQLRQSQKMEAIGTLAGGIAHDFNNILQSMLGYSALVQEKLPEGSLIREHQDSVVKAANRARDLVQQILSFSRKADTLKIPFKLQPIIKETLKLLRSSIPTNIEIKQKISDHDSLVFAEPTQIHQVLMNLCTNAYIAMAENGGVLTITVGEAEVGGGGEKIAKLEPGKYFRITVSDTGPGIEPEIQERIFEPYFTTRKKGEGSGMGLAVVHSIVCSHGGAVTVDSRPGKGTSFNVYLPCVEYPTVQVDIDQKEIFPRGDESLLIVDDEEEIVKLEKEMLEKLGYTVTTFVNSGEALKAFSANPDNFDLILTDMAMPRMTGSELTKKILAIRPDIPIILCTGFSKVVDEKKAASIGVYEYLSKPFTRKKLASAVRRALDKK